MFAFLFLGRRRENVRLKDRGVNVVGGHGCAKYVTKCFEGQIAERALLTKLNRGHRLALMTIARTGTKKIVCIWWPATNVLFFPSGGII